MGENYFLELRYGQAKVSLEVLVRWCALRGRCATAQGNEQPVYQAGAGFVDVLRDAPGGLWRALEAESCQLRMLDQSVTQQIQAPRRFETRWKPG